MKYSYPYQPLTIANTDLLRHYLQENGGYNFQFNGKEADNEINGGGNDYDFGARIYNSRLGRWFSVDPFAAKYPQLSPFNLVNNNPLYYLENEGKDYGLYINHKTKTITIKANYYVSNNNPDETAAALHGISVWKNASGKYNYTFTDYHGNTSNYNVKFDLNVIESNDPIESAKKDKIGNSIRIDQVKIDLINKNRNGSKVDGETDKGKFITLPSIRSEITDFHEIGHTLGLDHFWVGFMISELPQGFQGEEFVRTSYIQTLLRNNQLGIWPPKKLDQQINLTSGINKDDPANPVVDLKTISNNKKYPIPQNFDGGFLLRK